MLLQFLDQKIRRAFSNAAQQYDVLASLHKEIGRELLEKVKNLENPEKILDVGMGTGYLTNKLVHYFPGAQVFGLDFAPGMVEQAKKNSEGFTVVQADVSAVPFEDDTFDLIVSNLAYQWISDLPKAFGEARRVLKNNGGFYCTIFGYETLKELFTCLNNISSIKEFNYRRLASADQIGQALSEKGFKEISVQSEHIKVHFGCVTDLLKWLKGIGANRLAEDIPIGKEWLKKLEQEYSKNYSDRFGISGTFEVIWAEAKK